MSVSLHEHMLKACEHDILQTAYWNITWCTTKVQLGTKMNWLDFEVEVQDKGHGEPKCGQRALWEFWRSQVLRSASRTAFLVKPFAVEDCLVAKCNCNYVLWHCVCVIFVVGYGGQTPFVAPAPNVPYPAYNTPGGPDPAYKPQAPYPAAYPPQPQATYYHGAPPAASCSQTSYGSPYQATTSPSASQSYGQNVYHDDEQGIVSTAPEWAGSSFSDKKIRHTFIKKVCHYIT